MDFHNIGDCTEHLFRIALKRCGNIDDAEDLTQEVLLAYLKYPHPVANVKAWLSTVLSHKHSDMLRRKYRLPTVSIDAVPEEADSWEAPESDHHRPSEEEVRREVAFLAEKYRTVIVRHYLQGEKVASIAADLGIPKGTVLSRLSTGREHMKKGLESMKEYGTQSYQPERLDVSCHGTPGLGGEPWSVVAGDLMKQNILITAYENPLPITDIALALGIPTAYVEGAVKELVHQQLMVQTGNRYFTDFMMVTPEKLDKNINIEIAFTEKHYPLLLDAVKTYTQAIEGFDFVQELPTVKRQKLIYYFVLHLFSSALYTATQKIVPSKEAYPERPNGGRWIAAGNRYPADFDFGSCRFGKYTYGGERWASYNNFMGAKSICLRVYDTQPDLNKYEHGPVEIEEDNLAKMLYLISRQIPFNTTGFNMMFCRDIPHLTACGVLGDDNGKPFVNIPMVTPEEYAALDKWRIDCMHHLADDLVQPLTALFPQLKIAIPPHLEGRVAIFRQYTCYGIPMAFIKSATEKKDIDFTQATPPMVFVVEDDNNHIR